MDTPMCFHLHLTNWNVTLDRAPPIYYGQRGSLSEPAWGHSFFLIGQAVLINQHADWLDVAHFRTVTQFGFQNVLSLLRLSALGIYVVFSFFFEFYCIYTVPVHSLDFFKLLNLFF